MALSSHPESQPGPAKDRRVGDFRLIRELGRGGMGQVWEAEELSLRRRVALKLVHPERVGKHALELFAREARAGGRLSHPGIVAVHAHGESGGVHWISQELVEDGWTLRDFIDEMRTLDELPAEYDARIAQFVLELANALQAAHDAGVVHRDLKPQNVLITPDSHPKLTDFGLARITDETALSQTGELAGTYYYMSPEQVSARRMGLDHRTDIFSLGVVMYEALTLHRPFEGDTTHQIAEKILLHEPPPISSLRSRVPTDLAVIAAKAMEKRPDRRYASMAELGADLQRHLDNIPITARPATRRQRFARWTRRHPTGSAVGAVGLLALVLIGVLGFAFVDRAVAAARDGARVKRLSARTAYDELVERADSLWPPHPSRLEDLGKWEADALALVARLESDGDAPGLREQLAELEAQGETLPAASTSNAPTPLAQTRERVESLRRAQDVRAGDASIDPPEPDDPRFESSIELIARARALAGRNRQLFGREPEGLANARLALERATNDEEGASALDALAWAAFACGLEDEALEASEQAVELAEAVPVLAGSHNAAGLHTAIDSTSAELESAEARLDALQRGARPEEEPSFETEEQRWRHALLRFTVDGLERFGDPAAGLLAEKGTSPKQGWSIPRRRAVATRLARGFQEGGPFNVRWKEAADAIATVYPGLDLEPQMGLVPIGVDAESGLWEFWHIPSGEEPRRGSDDGRLHIEESSGLVFVLLHGGPTLVGAQVRDPGASNYRPPNAGELVDGPPIEIQLSPFFVSKYELNQAQWMRLTGENPSYLTPAAWETAITLLHPVEQVSWNEAQEVLGQFALQLPSEAQWEHACRAGSSAAYPTGAHSAGIEQYAKIDDDRYGHLPVGSLRPNAYGLHDMQGNVSEWCRDGWDRYTYAVLEGVDPVAPTGAAKFRPVRGGSFNLSAQFTHATLRESRRPFETHRFSGLRPSRAVDR